MKEVNKWNVYRWIVGLTVNEEFPIGSQMTLSGDQLVSIAESGDVCLGTLYSQPTTGFPGRAGIVVDGKFNHRGTGIAAEAITPGDRLKVGTPDGTTQRYAKFVPGTDDPGLERGVALSTATAENDEFDGLFN